MTQTIDNSKQNITVSSLPEKNVPLSPSKNEISGNLPPSPKTGFVGRRQELEQITGAVKQTRCITISGIEGQGKTCLAIEAAQRIFDTEALQKICFIDYTTLVGVDAVGLAVKTLANVLDKEINDITAANDALATISTLLIFDNVGTIPSESRGELLEVAKQWSETGECLVLLTGQAADFQYFIHSNDKHLSLPLDGLSEEDALDYCQRLFKLSPPPLVAFPQPSELLQTFAQIAFNPLDISILTIALKIHPWLQIENNLATLLAKTPNNPLLATLQLTLECWKAEGNLRGWKYWLARLFKRDTSIKLAFNQQTLYLLPRLGTFKGGAFEPDLLEITDFSKQQWQLLRSILESAGLIQFEFLPVFKVPYIKFHSALAPTLLSHFVSEEERIKVLIDYQQRYGQLAAFLFYEEGRDTDRIHALARQDLPNLLYATYGALDANEKWTIKFANQVKLFLDIFEFKRDSAILQQLIDQIKKVRALKM